MDEKNGLYFGLCAAAIGTSLGFAFPAFSQMRVLWYYPLQHRWAFEVRPAGLAMDWYGRALFASAAGAVAFLIARAIGRRLATISARSFGLWAAWAATATLLAMGVYTYQLAMRRPNPEPLPSWYVPK